MRLTKIYTRGGDAGETSLGDGTRTSKLDLRIAAYGTVDELNSALGLVLATKCPEEIQDVLTRVQNELFDLGADLSVPLENEGRLRVTQAQIDVLEHECDRFNASLPELRSFVLPGGGEVAARLHVARTICRRAERDALLASGAHRPQPTRARVPEPPLRPSLHPCESRERRRRPGGAALEAWELGVVLAGSFVAGYLGSMLGLVLGTLRLPLIVLVTGSPLAAAGTNIAISAAAAGAGGLEHAREGRVDWRVVRWTAPPSVAGAIAGALLANDVFPEALLYGLIAGVLVWSGIDLAFRPIARASSRAPPRWTRKRARLRDRRPRRRRRRDSGNAADAGADSLGRSRRSSRGRDEPRRRLSPRRRRLRDATRPVPGSTGTCSRSASRARFRADGSGLARPESCRRTCCDSRSVPCSSSSVSRSRRRRSSKALYATAGQRPRSHSFRSVAERGVAT